MKPKELPPIEVLREHFTYDHESGELRWKKPTVSRIKVGAIAGVKTAKGYMKVRFKGRLILVHRIAWALYYGVDPYPQIIDHKEGVEKGNAITNLRLATISENNYNRKLTTENKSGHRGVCYHKNHKRWVASANIDGKRCTIAECKNIEDAIAARLKFEEENNIFVRD